MTEYHGLDNERQVFFYEQDFYVLSNFSAFNIYWNNQVFDTSERAYHWEKFNWPDEEARKVKQFIVHARSAHDAFKLAQENKQHAQPIWDRIKFERMKKILKAKVDQHPYVLKKLMATGDRELIENSWRDDVWGWGPNRDGQNKLGKLWMEIRSELKSNAG
jgi:N-glycosidase YbiA